MDKVLLLGIMVVHIIVIIAVISGDTVGFAGFRAVMV
jgi:hypothetical protein